ncbi:hypothetical protein P8452_62039 [Trifolium repens]|nr:non-specific lipid transfer protein GPI-anchored [Trifolium repens]WJX78856.1 hypothetical protein P8452_62039 [Trifolium repens]
MISSTFTPCANIITGSTNNGLVPSTTCCDSLRSLMNTNMDCACLMMSSNSPILQLSINQVLAISLSQACNINGASVQCKASSSSLPGSPLPALGPAVIGPNSPTLPSSAPTPLSPQENTHRYKNLELAEAGASTPSSSAPTEAAAAPAITSRIIPVLTPLPSASPPSYYSLSSPSAILLFILIGIVLDFGIH